MTRAGRPLARAESPTAPAGTIAAALDAGARRLTAAGVAGARRDARLLVAHALGVAAEVVLGHPERALSADEAARISNLVELRAERRPMAHLLGVREFWGLPFRVTAETLDPRPDSETVVEAALALLPDHHAPLRVLDLGTGTGCLLLTLLSELPLARGIGTDISPAACAVARVNAVRLGLGRRATFIVADWGRGLTGRFDLILANPPYIADGDIDGLEPEVSVFEPRRALAGGADGLDCFRALAPDVMRLLAPAGRAILEVGAGQAAAVRFLVTAHGVTWVSSHRDLAGRERCIIVRREGDRRKA